MATPIRKQKITRLNKELKKLNKSKEKYNKKVSDLINKSFSEKLTQKELDEKQKFHKKALEKEKSISKLKKFILRLEEGKCDLTILENKLNELKLKNKIEEILKIENAINRIEKQNISEEEIINLLHEMNFSTEDIANILVYSNAHIRTRINRKVTVVIVNK